jgi:sucrose-6-phosphate hydrolase SacC (GH32 family)
VSSDLLHWEYYPTALAPGKNDPEQGIFSGNAFISAEGVPTLAYYGINAGICLAQSTDPELITWTKFLENPVIPEPKPGDLERHIYNVFDPHIWLEGNHYNAILGGNVKPHQMYDTAYLFRSNDLIHWEYKRPFYYPHPNWTDAVEDCACPDFFKLGNRDVLLCISHSHGTRYYLGQFKDGVFVPEEHHRMNWPGGPCFAPESLIDNQNRRIFWAWALDQRMGKNIVRNDLGVMTLPRVLALDDGKITINPPKEFEKLRKNERNYEAITISPNNDLFLHQIKGACLEIKIDGFVPADCRFGIKVRMSPGGEEQTSIIIDTAMQTLSIDTTRSSLKNNIFQPFPLMRGSSRQDVRVQTAPFELKPDEAVNLRIFIDRSILEVFANGRQCMTQRIYPSLPISLHLGLFSQHKKVLVQNMQVWELMTTYKA